MEQKYEKEEKRTESREWLERFLNDALYGPEE